MDLIPSLFSSLLRRSGRSAAAAATSATFATSNLVQLETARQTQLDVEGEVKQLDNLELEEDEEARQRPILRGNFDFEENDPTPTRRRAVRRPTYQEIPKKRAFMLVAFLSCLSFVIIIVNAVINFAKELTRNDQLMKQLTDAIVEKNNTACLPHE